MTVAPVRSTQTEAPESVPASAKPTPWPLAAVIALAAAVRLVWAVVVPVVPVSDALAYDTFARNVAAGGAYGWTPDNPSAYWPVGASFMYSLLYRVWHPDTWGYAPATALNFVLGMAVVVLSMLLANRWFGRRAALVTGVLAAFWPFLVQFTTILASESVFTALCLGALVAWPERGHGATARLLICGLLVALATYVRPTALLIPVALAGALFLTDRNLLNAIRRLIVVYAVVVMALLPWTLRNYHHFGKPILVSTNGGPNLWMGNNPATTGFYQDLPPKPDHLSEPDFHRQLGREAVAYIRSDPVGFVKRSAIKAVRLYERETIGVGWNMEGLKQVLPDKAITAIKVGGQGYYLGALALAIAGWMLFARSAGLWRALLHPATVMIAYFTVVHAVVVIQDRYHFPVIPMLAAFGAVAILRFARPWMPPLEGEPA